MVHVKLVSSLGTTDRHRTLTSQAVRLWRIPGYHKQWKLSNRVQGYRQDQLQPIVGPNVR